MVAIRLHNTRTRKKEPFAPLDPENVRMYVCGPTVYDRAHLGNARPVVVFDVLFRLLRHVYGEAHVTYVRNFTDVDDKINARAREMQAAGDTRDMNAIIRALTEETIGFYHADMDALGALRPTQEPRATEYIGRMVAMIETLTKRISPTTGKPFAYPAEGHVLFDVRAYPDYGRLSGRSVDDMIAGARVEVAPYKRDPMDFVLWKPSAADEPGWESPWGRGRPGWHIECSAMAHELLGPSFDIHGGGIDLQFPHHENEVAQSCCAHPDGEFARVWMHNEMVQVEGKKMSKSLGNFFTVRDLLERYDNEFAISNIGPAIRLRFLQTHYRSPVESGSKEIEYAATKIDSWWLLLQEFQDFYPTSAEIPELLNDSGVLDAIADDLNTPLAIKLIDDLVDCLTPYFQRVGVLQDEMAEAATHTAKKIFAALEFLGFDARSFKELSFDYGSKRLLERALKSNPNLVDAIKDRIERRLLAKQARDFAEADRIRFELLEAGISLRDTTEGTKWEIQKDFGPKKLDLLK